MPWVVYAYKIETIEPTESHTLHRNIVAQPPKSLGLEEIDFRGVGLARFDFHSLTSAEFDFEEFDFCDVWLLRFDFCGG